MDNVVVVVVVAEMVDIAAVAVAVAVADSAAVAVAAVSVAGDSRACPSSPWATREEENRHSGESARWKGSGPGGREEWEGCRPWPREEASVSVEEEPPPIISSGAFVFVSERFCGERLPLPSLLLPCLPWWLRL